MACLLLPFPLMALTVGMTLGPYEITGAIGAGGMGEVYRAHDSRLQRDVAIKTLPAAASHDPDRLRRFQHEALAAAALNHPNILAVYDTGMYLDVPYVVTELLEGETLKQQLSKGPLSIAKAVSYATKLSEGLAAAHSKGIVHRDLKPENVFLTNDGRIKILDFGLAKLTGPFGDSSNEVPTTTGTLPGVVLGTVGYMSPEQVRGMPTDHRSDIFSFGAVLYELLSGRRAFGAATTVESLGAILNQDPPELTSPAGVIPPGLADIVRRCLEKLPERRFHSANDLAFALAAAPVHAVQAAPHAVSRVPRRGGRWAAAATLLVLLSAIAAYVLSHTRADPAGPTRVRIAIAQPGTVSFTLGQGIVDVINQAPDEIAATVVATEGAVAAVRRLDSGGAEFALANNQLAFHAVKTDRLLGHRSPHIVGAAVLFGVPVHVLVRKGTDIASIEDLRGKRVSVGLEGSGERFTTERLLEYFELKPGDFTAVYLDIEDSLSKLLDGTIDAYVASRGLPHTAIAAAMATSQIRLLSLDRERVEGLRLNQPFMLPFTIPKGTYPRQDTSVITVSCKILLLASASVPDTVVGTLLEAIASRIPDLIARHPTAAEIDLARRPSIGSGMSIDLHSGAANFSDVQEPLQSQPSIVNLRRQPLRHPDWRAWLTPSPSSSRRLRQHVLAFPRRHGRLRR